MNTIRPNVILTEAQRRVIFALAKAVGVKVHVNNKSYCEVTDIDELIAEYEDWTYLTLDGNGISARRDVNKTNECSHAEYLLAIAEFKHELTFDIRLNENHIANVNVTKGEIIVGCQTFRLEKIEELVSRAAQIKDAGKV